MGIAYEKMVRARAGLILDNPFFGSLALRLNLKEDTSCETAWVNGIDIGFNPDFVAGMTTDEIKGLWIHEILHCALNHQNRRNNRDPREWNIACDYAVNDIALESKSILPNGALFSKEFKGKSADEIFSILGKRKRKSNDSTQNGNEAQKGQDSQGQGQSNENGQGELQNGQNSSKQGKKGQSENGQGSPECFGEVRDNPTKGNEESSNNEQEWNIATIQSANIAKAQGNHVPESIKRMIEDILEPKLDWKEILKRFIQNCAKNNYSWSKPNRRYIYNGLYLPSLHS